MDVNLKPTSSVFGEKEFIYFCEIVVMFVFKNGKS